MGMPACDVLVASRGWRSGDIRPNAFVKVAPDALHARLTAAAKRHRRSLNKEAIVCLEAGLGAATPTAEEELTRRRALRGSLGPQMFDPDAIDAFKREGRP